MHNCDSHRYCAVVMIVLLAIDIASTASFQMTLETIRNMLYRSALSSY